MLVLAIDTSTPVITVGVVTLRRPHELVAAAADGPGLVAAAGTGATQPTSIEPYQLLAERTVTDAFGHAEHAMPLVTAALAESGRAAADLDAVVVGIGPGPFTGLRVGMATAAALGDALDIPVHGAASHDAVAQATGDGSARDGDFLVVTDARRKEVYVSGYRQTAVREFGPQVVRPADLPGLVAGMTISPAWVTGAGAGLVAAVLALPERVVPGSVSVGLVRCAARSLLTGAIPGPLTPLYLRRPDAAEPHAPKPVLPADEAAAKR